MEIVLALPAIVVIALIVGGLWLLLESLESEGDE